MSDSIFTLNEILSENIPLKKIGLKYYKGILETENISNIDINENEIKIDISNNKKKFFLNYIEIQGGIILKFNKYSNNFKKWIKNENYLLTLNSKNNIQEIYHSIHILLENENEIYNLIPNKIDINNDKYSDTYISFSLPTIFNIESTIYILVYSNKIGNFSVNDLKIKNNLEIKNIENTYEKINNYLEKKIKNHINEKKIENNIKNNKNVDIFYSKLSIPNNILYSLNNKNKKLIELSKIYETNQFDLNENKIFVSNYDDYYHIIINMCLLLELKNMNIESDIKYKLIIQKYDKETENYWKNIDDLYYVDIFNKYKTISHININGIIKCEKNDKYKIKFVLIDDFDKNIDFNIVLYNGILKMYKT